MSAAQAAENGQNGPKPALKRLGEMPQKNA
jgi:hypothetical protein